VWTVGEGLTAAKLQAVSDNITYLKSQTDMIYVAVYNNDASTLAQYAAVILDPSYTADLAVKSSTIPGDMRAFGVVMSPSISSHATGIVAFGRVKTSILVNGPVAFGHSLQIGPNAQRAQDAGGGGMIGAGSLGVALGTNVSGDATISVLLDPHPLFFTAAQVITQKYATQGPSGGATLVAGVANITPNQLLLFWGMGNSAVGLASPLWNALTPTLVQAGGASLSYVGYLLGAPAASANFTGNFTAVPGAVSVLALNGINLGGGATTFGAWANQTGTGTTVNLVVACTPGDLVVCTVGIIGTGITLTGRNQTPVINNVGAATASDVQSAVATGTSVTFLLTIGGAITKWSADGFALHTA
jgi:hypothetical protein